MLSIPAPPSAGGAQRGGKHPPVSDGAGGAAAAGLRLLLLRLSRLMVPAKISADTLGSSCCVREIFFQAFSLHFYFLHFILNVLCLSPWGSK